MPKDASYRQGNWQKNSRDSMDRYREIRIGVIVHCEGGYIQGGAAYDHQGKRIEAFTRERVSTKQNFIDTVRSRKADALYTDALEGHLSAGLVHMANISFRTGRQTSGEAIREVIRGEKELSDSFERLQSHLTANRIDLNEHPLTLGPMLEMDPRRERFVGTFADEANRLVSRDYRAPFVVPREV